MQGRKTKMETGVKVGLVGEVRRNVVLAFLHFPRDGCSKEAQI
jgi:hypothetical protein